MSRIKKRPKQASWLRRLLVFGFKLTIVGAVILLGYLIYLDGSVTQRFSVERYQAPALVYGRSLTLVPQSTISRAEVVAERSEEHTSELQSRPHLVCRLLLEKKKEN